MPRTTSPRTYLVSGGLLGFGLGAVLAIVIAGGGDTTRTVTAYSTIHTAETLANVDTVVTTVTHTITTTPTATTTTAATTTALAGGAAATTTTTAPVATVTAEAAPADPRHPPPGFCETHACTPRFDEGTGYVVECDDGVWSHDGGQPQACADDGGPKRATE